MDRPMPALFLSHGAPDILLSRHPAMEALRALGSRLPRPRAILVVSAHWSADPIGVTLGQELPTIHDFGGFPPALYAQRYPVRGDDALSRDILRRLENTGLSARPHDRRGLDHGAWIPLKLMYPAADIPVIQVSLPGASLADCARLGDALTPLREQGVLAIGSGGSTHNLRTIKRDGGPDEWAIRFEEWLRDTVEGNQFERILNPSESCEHFRRAHPSLEHFAPLVVAWAAGDRSRPGRRIHHSFSYGNLGMSGFEFGAAP
jgi:4,5-DOPA dioxygenase extradiol